MCAKLLGPQRHIQGVKPNHLEYFWPIAFKLKILRTCQEV